MARAETTPDTMRALYKSILNGNMAEVKTQLCPAIMGDLSRPVTPRGDTVLHAAISMKHECIAREILKKCKQVPAVRLLRERNLMGDTVLHEAAATNMTCLAKDLLILAPDLLDMRNKLGETALFRAAHYGKREMFELLADIFDKKELEPNQKEALDHLKRHDGTTILHITILAQFFDIALDIANRYKVLVNDKDRRGMIGLQLLSSNPSAFKSSSNCGFFKKLIYHCVPTQDTEKKESCRRDTHESDHQSKQPSSNDFLICVQCLSMVVRKLISVPRKIYASIWRFLCLEWPVMENISKEKIKHKSALKLAHLLIPEDLSWEQSEYIEVEDRISIRKAAALAEEEEAAKKVKKLKEKKRQLDRIDGGGRPDRSWPEELPRTPPGEGQPISLLLATSTGIVEIVEEILKLYPQAVEHVSDMGHNILHVAIQYRQLKIFRIVKSKEIAMFRLVRQLDQRGYTVLHQVGVTKFQTGGTHSGPAFHLQEELRWLKRVKRIMPPHYEMHLSKEHEETAQEFFDRTHKKLLKEAKQWLKRTSESCSTVAVLIATVAFAAAYTVPGGSDQSTGVPVLLYDYFFLIFTVMDVLSLASSLTSVVMFLSILTSPFELESFRHSLPRKLTLGFTFLFFSVAVTMLAFAATIVLIVHLKRRLTRTLIYTAAFLPVSIFAILQFPLYVASSSAVKFTLKLIRKVLPNCFLPRRFRKKPTLPISKSQ